jgi:mannose-6-phosphate isomerase-like protein (cupin superfamily)
MAVTPGDAVVIPVGWAFQFSADRHEELRFLCITMPPWPGAEEAIDVEIGGLGAPTLSPP